MTDPKTPKSIREALDKWNPIAIEHTEKAVRSVLKDAFGGDFCDEDVKTTLDLLEKQAAIKKHDEDVLAAVNSIGFDVKDTSKETVEKIGRFLNSTSRFWATSKLSKIQHYNPEVGIWQDDGEELIIVRTTEMLDKAKEVAFTSRIVSEVIAHIRGINMHPNQPLVGPPEIMVFKNGRINIETGTFYPDFDPDEHHITALPVIYDPEAVCPDFKKFLDDVLASKDDRLAIEEFLGYMLYKSNTYEIVVLLNGSGSNGKTILLDVVKRFLGQENITSVTPQRLEKSNFAAAQLHGKLANICGDIPSQALKYTGLLKMITSTDLIYAEHKNRNPFDFENYAKLMSSCNTVPESYDDTNAFYRRWRIIDFPHTFSPDVEGYVPKDVLMERITSAQELSGILNLALEGLQRLRENHQLTGTSSVKEKKADYLFRSDPAHFFFGKYLCQDSHAPPIEKGMLYDIYANWCHAKGKIPISDQWFAKKLKRFVPYAAEQRPSAGNRKRNWIGIRLDWEAIDKDCPTGPTSPPYAAISPLQTLIEDASREKHGLAGLGGQDSVDHKALAAKFKEGG